MAFDAGAIEATLTLNRNPFTAGLEQAKLQAAKFSRQKIELPVTAKLDRTSLQTVKEQINKAVGRIQVKVSLDRESLKSVQAQINRAVGRIQARVSLDRESLARVREQIARTAGRIKAKVTLDRESLAALRERLATLNARVTVRPVLDRDALLLLRARLEAMSFRVNVRANIDRSSLQSFAVANQSFAESSGNLSRMQGIIVAIIALLPVMASLFTATVGAVGALAGSLLIAGLGAGAFALVAVPAFKQVKEAVAAGQAEIDKLPPGLREAGNAMKGLLSAYDELVKQNQRITGIALASWFNAGTAALKTLNPLVDASAKAFANVGDRAKIFFEGVWWKNFVSWLTANMMPVVSRLGSILFSLIEIVGNLTRAFMDLGGSKILDMITQGLAEFALWTDKIGQNKTFQMFMDSAVRSLPVVGALIGNLLEFIIKLAIGLEPLGTLIIRIFNGILGAINSLPIPVIQGIALAIGAVWAAMALGATGPVGLAIGVLAGLAAIFIHLAETNDGLKASFNSFIDDLKAKWQPIWDTIVTNFNTKILPAWENLRAAVTDKLIPALQRFGAVFMEEVWPKIQPFVDELTSTFIPAVLNCLNALISFIAWLVDVFGPTVAEEMGSAVTVFQGAFDMIAGALNIFTGIFTRDWTTFTQGITEITRGFWTIIAGMFGTNLDGLRDRMQAWDREIDAMWHTFWDGLTGWFKGLWEGVRLWWSGFLDILRGDTSAGADKIGQAWRKIANLFRDPINWVINVVINDGIIGAWNQVMGWIGVGGISGRVPGLPAFARGGPVSGGIPGKDSVPILAQQGEYVLSRPAVEAMGGISSVDRMHTAARGGVAGGPTFEQGGPIGVGRYALGGPVTTTVSMWSLFGGQVESLLRGLGFGSSPMGGMIGNAISQIPGALVNKVLAAAQAKLSSIFQTIVSAVSGNVAGVGAVGGGGARAWIIAHESGGNPRAQNPVSSASGLYQMIDGTWRAYGGSTAHAKDASVAEQNAVADRYVASRYGSWENAQAFWQSHGYYDQGGILPTGTTLTTNNTGQPEAILTQAQFRALTSSRSQGLSASDVIALINATVGGGTSRDTYNVMLPERASVRELADSLDFKRRVVQKGRYSR